MPRSTLACLVGLSFLTLPLGARAGGAPEVAGLQAPGEKEIKLAEQDEDFLTRCNAAVQRGTAWLLTQPGKDGRWTTIHDDRAGHGPYLHGATALALLALLECEVNKDEAAIVHGFQYLEAGWKAFAAKGKQPGAGAWKTYEVGLTLMALDALDRWVPATMKGKTQPVGLLKPAQRDWAKELRDFLLANQAPTREVVGGDVKGGGNPLHRPRECWHYPSGEKMATDHSNTQYAVLGLRAAARLGFPSPKAAWLAVIDNFLALQEPSGPPVPRVLVERRAKRGKAGGTESKLVTLSRKTDHARGWGYPGGSLPRAGGKEHECATGSMTTVGIACLAIALDELSANARGDRERKLAPDPALSRDLAPLIPKVDQAGWDGVAWLVKHWKIDSNPESGHWHYYYLYGLERAGVLWRQPTFGEHDWYRLGGELLCKAQRANGSWDDQNDDHELVSTCFALLFLQRATLPPTTKTR